MMRRGRRIVRGLTLLEVILSVTIVAIMMSVLMAFFHQTLATRDHVARVADRTHVARQVLEHMADELRGCLGVEEFGFPDVRLVGTRREIVFVTTTLPSDNQYVMLDSTDDPPIAKHDLRLVRYRLWVDDGARTEDGDPVTGGILREEKQVFNQFDPTVTVIDDATADAEGEGGEPTTEEETNPLTLTLIQNFGTQDDGTDNDWIEIRRDLWSSELGYLEFRYFDGLTWSTEWTVTDGNPLPQMVLIIVGFDSISMDEYNDEDLDLDTLEDEPFLEDEHLGDDRYWLLVRLPSADRFFSSGMQHISEQAVEESGTEEAAE